MAISLLLQTHIYHVTYGCKSRSCAQGQYVAAAQLIGHAHHTVDVNRMNSYKVVLIDQFHISEQEDCNWKEMID